MAKFNGKKIKRVRQDMRIAAEFEAVFGRRPRVRNSRRQSKAMTQAQMMELTD